MSAEILHPPIFRPVMCWDCGLPVSRERMGELCVAAVRRGAALYRSDQTCALCGELARAGFAAPLKVLPAPQPALEA